LEPGFENKHDEEKSELYNAKVTEVPWNRSHPVNYKAVQRKGEPDG
jgi:hypothetical protein